MKELLITILVMLILGLMFIGFWYVIRWLWDELARRNILVTFRTEGEIKAKMKGETCIGFILAVKNHIIDPWSADIYRGTWENLVHIKSALAEKHKENKRRKNKAEKNKHFVERRLEVDEKGKLKLDENGLPKLKEDFKNDLIKANRESWFENQFGVVWIGFPPHRIFTYRFQWVKYARQPGETTDDEGTISYRMFPREDVVDSLYYRYPSYGLRIDDANAGAGLLSDRRKDEGGPETQEKVEIVLDVVYETITLNPKKTLFRSTGLSSSGDWIIAVSAEIRDQLRPFVSRRTYEEINSLTSPPGSGKEETNVRKILEAEVIGPVNEKVREYGQEIGALRIVNVDLKDDSIREAANKYFVAKQSADAAVEEKRGRLTLADAAEREAAAPLLGRAKGLAAIAAVKGGKEMQQAEELGKLKGVYAPGKENVFLNVDTSAKGKDEEDT